MKNPGNARAFRRKLVVDRGQDAADDTFQLNGSLTICKQFSRFSRRLLMSAPPPSMPRERMDDYCPN